MKSIIEFRSEEVLDTQNGIVAVLKQCSVKSKDGGIIPAGIKVYRDDKRDISELERDDGFIPSSYLEMNETYTKHAISQINVIMNMKHNPQDFIYKWKHSMGDLGELDHVIKGKKGRMAGVCCAFGTGQMGGHVSMQTILCWKKAVLYGCIYVVLVILRNLSH